MTKKLLALVLMATAVLSFSSCLNSDEDEITYYDDTAVTAFSVSTIYRYVHTTGSTGADSTYKVTQSTTAYPFYIDQENRTIYNPDSLPAGTDASRVLCTISTKNSGTAVLNLRNRQGGDSLVYYQSTDTIDFSNPVRLRVYNTTGQAYREYTIKINVHQQDGDAFNWSAANVNALAGMTGRKMVAVGSNMYLLGLQGGATAVYRLDGTSWQSTGATLDQNAYLSATALGGYLYTLNNGNVVRSADGSTWETTGTNSSIKQLVGASASKLYALTDNGLAWSEDGGQTWTDDRLDAAADSLPNSNISFACMPSAANDGVYNLVMVGTRDGKTLIWTKVEEPDGATQQQPWLFYPTDDYNTHTLPALANLHVVVYDGQLLATGGDFTTVYASADEGLTWLPTTTYALPAWEGRSAVPFAWACSNDNTMLFSPSGSTTVYSAKLARLSWQKPQTIFTE